MQAQKIWFKASNFNLWIPVSLEGCWGVTAVFTLLLFLIATLNNVSSDVAFSLSQHWLTLVELAVVIASFYYVTRGHVDKKY